MDNKIETIKKPWPIDRQALDEVDLIPGTEMKNLSAKEESRVFTKILDYLTLKEFNLLPWPIDPNAPIIKKPKRLGIIGYQNAILVCEPEHLKHYILQHDLPHFVGEIKEMTIAQIEEEYGVKIDPQMVSPKPIPIIPIEELKLNIEKVFVGEENRKYSHKVTPKQQRNRERFNRKK